MNDCLLKEPNEPSPLKIEPSIGILAETTLLDRFSEVQQRIDEFLSTDSGKSEAVHQLRVASRRAVAGLDFFREVVVKSFRCQTVKQLKTLRSGLGNLRDWDVLAEQIGRKSSRHAESLVLLIHQNHSEELQKTESRTRAINSNLTFDFSKFELPVRRSAQKLLPKPFKKWAFRRTHKIAKQFLSSLRQTDLTAETLHRLRIRGKKLRYTLEILEPVVPDVLDSPAYRRIQKLQTLLGELQDGIVQRDVLKRQTKDSDRRGLRQFVKDECRKRKRKRSKLLRKLKRLRSKKNRAVFAKELDRLTNVSACRSNSAPIF